MPKTKIYTKKAVDNYRTKHDFLNLTLDLGTKERLKAVDLDNRKIVDLILKELKKREKTAKNAEK